ncbi:disease resistance protein RGA2-like [Mangifera indica]|uniref:disease resistance protein RGA2-like n=1 Tax=Mangifera indica TaxID=29780 RepID=UPI001CF9C7CE|nr:disease resistance protein RGA2-like [Mangifera indica]
MAEAIVNLVLEQLLQITTQKIGEEVSLVGNVKIEVEKLRSNLRAIQAVLLDAEERQMKDKAVRRWLDQLKDTSYDMEDVLDEWNTEIMKLQVEGDLEDAPAPKQKEMKSIEAPERIRTTSLVDVAEIYGREFEKNSLVSKLLDERNEEQKDLSVISLIGMGGIGKTTLAQLAYDNDEVKSHFDTRVWVCVSDPFDELRVAKSIIEGLKCHTDNLVELESLLQCIHQCISGEKFLLVLDDVWLENYNKWKQFYYCLKYGSHGSKVLITTRKDTVASTMGSVDPIIVEKLSEEECWLLFRQFAFSGRPPKECEN